MNLSTCSKRFQKSVNYLESNLGSQSSLTLYSMPAYYALYQYHPDQAVDLLNNVEEFSESIQNAALYDPDDLAYLAEIARNEEMNDSVVNLLDRVKEFYLSRQSNSGRIESEYQGTGGPLLFLSTWCPEDPQLDRSFDFIPEEIEHFNELDRIYPIILCIDALCTRDYFGNLEKIQSLSDWLVKELENKDTFGAGWDEVVYFGERMLNALTKLPGNYEGLKSDILAEFPDIETRDDSLYMVAPKDDDSPSSKASLSELGSYILGLRHAGEGQTLTKVEADWEKELEQKRAARDRPNFSSTLPTTSLHSRSTDIQRKAEMMINRSEDQLRISTLRIDVLHNLLVDKIEQGVKVEIVTSSGVASGDRKKMKKAVMNELVKRTEGNVRESDLNHSRFIIQDEEAALISSADLTRDQLYDSYNSAIYTKNPETVCEAVRFFDKIWADSSPRGTKN